MKNVKGFNVGDKVFAKVKGYPAWPAMIIENHVTKYNVKFYGTGETAVVKPKDLFYYLKYKSTFIKSLKRKDYNDAIEEIESAIEENGGSDGNIEKNVDTNSALSSTNVKENVDSNKNKKRKRSVSIDKTDDLQVKKKILDNETEKVDNGNSTEIFNTNDDHVGVGPSVKQPTKEIDNEDLEITTINTDKKLTESEQPETEVDTTINEYDITQTGTNVKKSKVFSSTAPLKSIDFKIITDEHLRGLIAYNQHVKNFHERYKKELPNEKQEHNNQIVVAELPSGKLVGIKYNQDPLPTVNSEYERAELDDARAKAILAIKSSLSDGTFIAEDHKNFTISNLDIDRSHVQQIRDYDIIERKRIKLKWLKIEKQILDLDESIKDSLGLDRAKTDCALGNLRTIQSLEIDPLMLKKNPHIVDMIKRLCKYIGNVKKWNLNEEQLKKFESDAKEVREVAKKIYETFAMLFGVSDDALFWNIFIKKVDEFKEQVKHLHENVISAITCEPNSRESFLEKLDQEELEAPTSKVENKLSEGNSTDSDESTGENVNSTPISYCD